MQTETLETKKDDVKESKDGPTVAQRMNLALKIVERQMVKLRKLANAHQKPTAGQIDAAEAWLKEIHEGTFGVLRGSRRNVQKRDVVPEEA